MNKRGAYFFVVDAILGGSIFLITLIIILSSYANNPIRTQSYLVAEDTMQLLQNTKIVDFRNDYIDNLRIQGNITNAQNTLFQQIVEFHYKEKSELARNFTKHVLDLVIEEQYGYSYYIGSSLIYNRTNINPEQAKVHLTSKKVAFYSPNQTIIRGPEIAELRLWS